MTAKRAPSRGRKIDWEQIRAEYETGATQSELSRAHGVSRAAIQKHIEAEGWTQDVEPAIQRKVAEKVAGVVAGCNPKKKAEALDAEVRPVDVRMVWTRHRPHTKLAKELTALATQELGLPILKTALALRVAYPEALGSGLTVAEMPDANAKAELRELVAEIRKIVR